MSAGRADRPDQFERPAEDEEVGYCRPPIKHRFQPGQSGNKAGRPPKAKSAKKRCRLSSDDLLLKEAHRVISIVENGKTKRLPMVQVVHRRVLHDAAKGKHQSQRLATELIEKAEQKKERAARLTADKWLRYKRKYEQESGFDEDRGAPRPERVPHPADILVDEETCEVRFNGPRTPADKAEWDRQAKARRDALHEIIHLEQERRHSRHKAAYDAEIREQETICRQVEANYPDPATRRAAGFDLERHRRAARRRLKSTDPASSTSPRAEVAENAVPSASSRTPK